MNKNLLIALVLVVCFSNPAFSQKKKETPTNRKNLIFTKAKGAWQVGVFGGTSILVGDVSSNFFSGSKPTLPGHNFGLFINKSWSFLFSTRLRYSTMVMFTNDATGSTLTRNLVNHLNERSSGLPGYQPGELFFHNSRTQGHDLTLDLVFSVGNINFNKRRSSIVFKIFPSIGALAYQTFYDHLDADGNAYDYSSVANLNLLGDAKRSEVLKDLANLRDGQYETRAETHTVNDRRRLLNYNPRLIYGLGVGAAIRVTDFLSIDIETKHLLTKDDLIDGMQWQEPNASQDFFSRGLTRGFDSYNQVTLGLTFSILTKKTGESKNMDNPLAGDDAFEKETKKTDDKAAANDSALAEMEDKVKDFENKINELEQLVQTLSEDVANNDNSGMDSDEMNGDSDDMMNGDSGDGDSEGSINNLDDPSFKHRNGEYIYIADLEGDLDADYYLIIGSYRVKSNSINVSKDWQDKGVNTTTMIDQESGLYRLIVDFTDDHATALDMLDEYRSKLRKDIWLLKQAR